MSFFGTFINYFAQGEGTPLFGYYTTVTAKDTEDYVANNVIATTNASDWYIHVFANIQDEDAATRTLFSNSWNVDSGFVTLISDGLTANLFQYDTTGTSINLTATHNFTGNGTLTYTYEAATNDYRIYCNGSIIGSRSGSTGIFNSGSTGADVMQILRRPDNHSYRLINSSLFSIAAGNDVPTPAEVATMHNNTMTNKVADKLNDSDHQWNLATYSEGPSTLPDNTTGTAADFTLEGDPPPNRRFTF